jgi:hypothetical protein
MQTSLTTLCPKKNLIAEVLINDLHIDLYRINHLEVVRKYVGETE